MSRTKFLVCIKGCFVDSLQKSENTAVQLCYNLIMEGSGSTVSDNVSHICHSFTI